MIAFFNAHRVAILVVLNLITIGWLYRMVCHKDAYRRRR